MALAERGGGRVTRRTDRCKEWGHVGEHGGEAKQTTQGQGGQARGNAEVHGGRDGFYLAALPRTRCESGRSYEFRPAVANSSPASLQRHAEICVARGRRLDTRRVQGTFTNDAAWPRRYILHRGQETSLLKRPQARPRRELLPISWENLVDTVRPQVQQLPLERRGGGGVEDPCLEQQGAQAGKAVGLCAQRGRGGQGRAAYERKPR